MPSKKKKLDSQHKLSNLQEVLNFLHVRDWDAVIIGDGSGSGWGIGAGWASVLIDRHSGARKIFWGGMNVGTVTLGELFPYLHAMVWYASKDGPGRDRRRQATREGRNLKIHAISDSEPVVKASIAQPDKRTHTELWSAMDAFRKSGYFVNFHHIPRNVVDMNVLVDEVSRQARVAMKEVYADALKILNDSYGVPTDATAYDFCP